MTQTDSSAPELTLSELSEQIELWRKTRKKRRSMPEPLWQAAANLSKQLSINEVSKALRLNHTALKKRVYPDKKNCRNDEQQKTAFIELDFTQPLPVSECVVEMHNSCGASMKMHFRGGMDLDLLELSKAFWAKKP